MGFLLSGSGSTLNNFLKWQKDKKFAGKIAVVISSKPEVKGLQIAKEAGIPSYCIEYQSFKGNIEAYSKAITDKLLKYNVKWVVMGGFLSFYQVPSCYQNKVFNVHPSLIPAFCGQGMYGSKVHEAALEYGVKLTGCTVHLVNNQYDAGPIVAQKAVVVEDNDTPQSLAQKVQAQEREIYPLVVQDFILGNLKLEGRRVIKA